jgi:hypothetical protein
LPLIASSTCPIPHSLTHSQGMTARERERGVAPITTPLSRAKYSQGITARHQRERQVRYQALALCKCLVSYQALALSRARYISRRRGREGGGEGGRRDNPERDGRETKCERSRRQKGSARNGRGGGEEVRRGRRQECRFVAFEMQHVKIGAQ